MQLIEWQKQKMRILYEFINADEMTYSARTLIYCIFSSSNNGRHLIFSSSEWNACDDCDIAVAA